MAVRIQSERTLFCYLARPGSDGLDLESQCGHLLDQEARGHGRGAGSHLSQLRDLEMAFDSLGKGSHIANALQTTRKTVRISQALVVECRLSLQFRTVRDLLRRCRSDPPMASLDVLKFDTAKIPCSVDIQVVGDTECLERSPW